MDEVSSMISIAASLNLGTTIYQYMQYYYLLLVSLSTQFIFLQTNKLIFVKTLILLSNEYYYYWVS